MIDAIDGLGSFHYDLRAGVCRPSRLWTGMLGSPVWPTKEVTSAMRAFVVPEDHHALDAIADAVRNGMPLTVQYRVAAPDRDVLWLESRMRVIRNEDGVATDVVGMTLDVTEQRAGEERLAQLAFRDAQTGLPSRAALQGGCARPEHAGAVLLVALRWMTTVSQRRDFMRTAEAVAAAETLQKVLPDHAMLVRYGDDTFAIVFTAAVRARNVSVFARKIVASFEHPLKALGGETVVVPSIGVAVAGTRKAPVGDLCSEAECALRAAAEGAVVVYDAQLAAALERRTAIDRNLRHAIVGRRIDVAYQPIVALAGGRIVGAEALMRWNCPGMGPVPPSEFIAIAEKNGMILRLGEWILREACAQARRWQLAGHPTRIAVNVSARQVEERDFMRLVAGVCDSTSLDPRLLELELTESTMMNRDGIALRNLQALRRMGVRISVDDFGTGYSALSYLKSLPLDTVKIDRSFVAPIASDEFQADVAHSVIGLAQRRGLSVIGEGVETAEQVATLRAMGCDEAQGYLFGRPMTATDLTTLLERDRITRLAAS